MLWSWFYLNLTVRINVRPPLFTVIRVQYNILGDKLFRVAATQRHDRSYHTLLAQIER